MWAGATSSLFWFGRFTPAMRAKSLLYPWRCLWRGLVQMTMVRPCRLITRQRSHMGLTDGLTFMNSFLAGKGCARADASRRGPSWYQDRRLGEDPRPRRRHGDRVLEM